VSAIEEAQIETDARRRYMRKGRACVGQGGVCVGQGGVRVWVRLRSSGECPRGLPGRGDVEGEAIRRAGVKAKGRAFGIGHGAGQEGVVVLGQGVDWWS